LRRIEIVLTLFARCRQIELGLGSSKAGRRSDEVVLCLRQLSGLDAE
jgi:hypothetical protein